MTAYAWHVTKRKHSPLCDSQLGPEFVVRDGVIEMTLHVCVNFACLTDREAMEP